MSDLIKPARNQDKAYWIEYAEKLEVEIAGKNAVIDALHEDIKYYRNDWKEQMITDTFDAYAEALENPDKDDCYLQAYRAGWNDALQELAIDGAEELKTRLWMFANRMKKK